MTPIGSKGGRARAYEETPVYFPAKGHTLFGILTRPVREPIGVTVTMCTGGGHLTLTHRNGMFVRFARGLAGLGFDALRFDYHGTGESTGLVERFDLDDLFDEDLRGALDFLRGRGMTRHVLVGTCFGARTILKAAAGADDVLAIAMVSPPISDPRLGEPIPISRVLRSPRWKRVANLPGIPSLRYSRVGRATRAWALRVARRARGRLAARTRSRSGSDWVTSGFIEPLRTVVARGLPIMLLYGEQDEMYQDFQAALGGDVGRVLEEAGDRLQFRVLPGRVHGFENLATQDAVVDLITEWLRQCLSHWTPRVPSRD